MSSAVYNLLLHYVGGKSVMLDKFTYVPILIMLGAKHV